MQNSGLQIAQFQLEITCDYLENMHIGRFEGKKYIHSCF